MSKYRIKDPLKRYLLFIGNNWYPSGGWSDFIGSFETIEEALKKKEKENPDWYQIVDIFR